MDYVVATAYCKEFTTSSPTTGAAADADSLPVATANHNGTDDGSFSLTVAKLDTGRYKITGTVPSGYTVGDVVNVSVSATVGGVSAKAVADTFRVVAAKPAVVLSSSDVSGVLPADLTAIKTTALGSEGASGRLAANFVAFLNAATQNLTGACANQSGDAYALIGAAGAGLTAVTGVTLAASQHVIVDSGTVTTLTNLPSIPNNWLTAAGIAASALNGKGDWLLASGVPTRFSSMAIDTNGYVTFANSDVATDAHVLAIPTNPLTSLGSAAPANWIDANAVKPDAVTKIQAGLSTYAGGAATPSDVRTQADAAVAAAALATHSDAVALASGIAAISANTIAEAVWTLASAIDGKTPAAALAIIAAATAGLMASSSGDNHTTVNSFKGLDKTTTRLVGTTDADGDRLTVEYP